MNDYGITCDCGCMEHCSHKDKVGNGVFRHFYLDFVKIFISLVLIICGFLTDDVLSFVFFLVSAIVLGYKVVYLSIKGMVSKNIFNENTLMVIASVVAFFIGESIEGTLIIFLYSLGGLLEDVATFNAKIKIAGLSELQTSIAHLVNSEGMIDVSPNEITIGSILEIRQGEKVPIDSVVIAGNSEFDTKFITGESSLSEKGYGDKVYSGFINVGAPILVKTTKLHCDSTVEKMISLVGEANERKSKNQNFVTKFAKIYTPIIIIISLIIALIVPIFDDFNFLLWIRKALSFIVISCPCALVISVPLAYFVGIGNLAKNGVLVKGSKFIEKLSKVKIFAFDKTGTITAGHLCVKDVQIDDIYDKETILKYVVSLEGKSNHPIAKGIVSYYKKIKPCKVFDFQEVVGNGIIAKIDDKTIKIGNYNFIKQSCQIEKDANDLCTVVYICIDDTYVGKILLEDKIKPECINAIKSLKKNGILQTIMFSGDKKLVANEVGKKVGIDRIYSELLPQDKLTCLNNLKDNSKGFCAYVGDGVNDLLVLSNADVGISMGCLGSDIAIENSDMIILDDNLLKLSFSLKMAQSIQKTVIFNMCFALFSKFAIMALSLFLTVPIWLVMFGDVGVMLICVLNSLRLSLKKI